MKRVLIIKLWALGDILMATPMLTALRSQYPNIHITWMVDSSHGDLLLNHPGIDELVVLDTGHWRRLLRRGQIAAWARRSRSLSREMASHCFDAVINCHPDKWWSLFLCVAPIRVGLFPSAALPVTHRFYTQALSLPQAPRVHNTDHYLAATQALGCPPTDKGMTIGKTPEEESFWEDFCRKHHIPAGKRVVILAPFSTGENRVWEPERLAEIADWLHSECRAQVVMPVSPKDGSAAAKIAGMCCIRPPIIAQGTTLRQYVALLRAADLVICGDSSPMHISGALQKPYVVLFGPTPIAERAPLVGRGIALAKPLPCAPCDKSGCSNPIFRECLKLITVADVQAAVLALMPSLRRKENSKNNLYD